MPDGEAEWRQIRRGARVHPPVGLLDDAWAPPVLRGAAACFASHSRQRVTPRRSHITQMNVPHDMHG